MSVAVVGTTTGFSVTGSASVALCAKNTARSYLLIQNQDPSNSVYISFGTNNAAGLGGILVGPGNCLELSAPLVWVGNRFYASMPEGDVAAIAAPGTTVQLSVTEK